jgi:O-antigen biosynthesis protein
MIVRDAERSLRAALESARPFMDEMIVVDTGSLDGSRAVAAERGARVFDFAWCDDFSAARNYSLDQATSDWIFWMDADDLLPAESGAELRRLIAGCPKRDAAFWVTVREESRRKDGQRRVTGHGHVKLFPRHDKIRFRYRIHEQIAPVVSELGLPIRRSTAFVRHAADRSLAAQRARRERNLRLALLDRQQYPDDPFVLLSLGMTHLFLLGGLPAAIDYFRQSVARCPRGAPLQLNAYLYWGQALASSGQRTEEEQVYREALALFPDDAALLARLANLCDRSGRLAEAARCLETALARGRVRSTAIRLLDGPERSAFKLGQIYTRMGQRVRAERFWRDFLKRHPEAASIQRALQKSYLAPCSIIVRP